ncbi:MAG: hypothetical protein ACKV2T_20850 [Kofleriaceae bacterium]
MRPALALAITLVPAIAMARPITAGVNLGVDQSKESGQSGEDPNKSFGLFGRLGLTPRLSAQVEVSKIRMPDGGAEIRSLTGLLVVDLSSSKTFVPVLLVGFGADRSSIDYGDCIACTGGASAQSATHIEGGFGFEYRAPGGFTLGADVRMGGRSIDQSSEVVPLGETREPAIALYYPSGMQEGEYRSARLRLGIRF